MDLSSIGANTRRFGVAAGVHDLAARIARRAVGARVLRCMALAPATAKPVVPRLSPFERVEWGMLPFQVLRDHARREIDLDAAFLDECEALGDWCLGYVIDRRLAHYQFFSSRPTEIEPGLWFAPPRGAVHGYKAFTHPDYRGRRLHAASVYGALTRVAEWGAHGIVSYAAAHNFRSVRSHSNAGFVDVGSVLLLRRGQHAAIHLSARARRYGISVFAPKT